MTPEERNEIVAGALDRIGRKIDEAEHVASRSYLLSRALRIRSLSDDLSRIANDISTALPGNGRWIEALREAYRNLEAAKADIIEKVKAWEPTKR